MRIPSCEAARRCASDFCGGGTDVPPYPEKFGGCVLSCTIDKYAYVSVRPYVNSKIHVISEDQGLDIYFEPNGGDRLEGRLDLAQAIFRRFSSVGLECHIAADAPPGSGLGSSSSMIVALIEALCREQGVTLSKYQKAELAFQIERGDLGIVGGMQDQYAASFGGFNFIEFDRNGVYVTPLALQPRTALRTALSSAAVLYRDDARLQQHSCRANRQRRSRAGRKSWTAWQA